MPESVEVESRHQHRLEVPIIVTFLVAVKTPERSDLREEGLLLAHNLRGYSPWRAKAWQWEQLRAVAAGARGGRLYHVCS